MAEETAAEETAAGYYGAPHCGGLITGVGKGGKSGKGESRDAGPGRSEPGTRLYKGGGKMFLWPAWRKSGTHCYCSSRWDEWYQIYDWYWTPKSVHQWWESNSYGIRGAKTSTGTRPSPSLEAAEETAPLPDAEVL